MRLQTTFAQDVKGEGNQKQIGEIFRACSRYLARLERFDLKSLVPGKQYFAFSNGKKLSRAVNIALFTLDLKEWGAFCQAISQKRWADLDPTRTTRVVYSAAVSFFCNGSVKAGANLGARTLVRSNARTPLIGGLFARAELAAD